MGINRIRLQNGAMGDPRVDARMQQTYQQNIADNQAQQARNEGILQAAANRLFPEGNFQQIRANAPDQATYNIDATADLVRNNPFGIIGEVAAPALTAATSVPYDVIQGIGRAVDQSDVDTSPYAGIVDDTEIPRGLSLSDLGQAIDAENPLSSALERTIGAATPLAERMSGINLGMSSATAAETPTPDASTDRPTMADVAGPIDTPMATQDASSVPVGTRIISDGRNRYEIRPDGSLRFVNSVTPAEKDYIDNFNQEPIEGYKYIGSQQYNDPSFPNGLSGDFLEFIGYGDETKGDGNFKYLQNLASGGRVGFQDGTDPNLTARQVAEQNPELDATRKQLFGENYLDDIDQGTGIAQYYTGFGQMPTLDYTPAAVDTSTPAVDVTQPVVDTGGGGGGAGISTGNETTTPMDVREQYGAVGQYEPYSPTIDTRADQPPSLGFGNPPTTPMDVREQYGAVGQYEGYVNPADVEAGLATESMFDTPEQTNAINEAFNNVKDLGEAGVDKLKDSLVALGGKVKEGFDNTIEIGGKTIDLTRSLVGGAISLATGIPGVGFLLNLIQEDKYNKEAQGALGEIDMLKTTAGGLTVDKYGKNIQSMFGDYDDYNLERQINLQEKFDDGTIQEYKEDGTLTYFGKELEDRKTIEKQLNETRLEKAGQEQKDYVQEIETQPAVDVTIQSGRDEADRQKEETGVATVETDYGTRYESSGGTFASAEEAAEKGDGPSGGGGKIVCTMMNDSYGFGSFRNKIWLRHSRNMKPEYQIGYHKIFLPLVKLSKKNKVLKKTLEHIAIHRTIDIRQEAKGKTHLLGRVYRKILEPICYIVGKHAKR